MHKHTYVQTPTILCRLYEFSYESRRNTPTHSQPLVGPESSGKAFLAAKKKQPRANTEVDIDSG